MRVEALHLNRGRGQPGDDKVGHRRSGQRRPVGSEVLATVRKRRGHAVGNRIGRRIITLPVSWMTCDHSENGRFVVTMTAAFSARSAITWNISSHAVSASGTYPSSSMQIRSSRSHRPSARLSWLACAASASSLISADAVANRTRRRWRHAATHSPVARWVFPVPASPTSRTGSALVT